MLEPSPNSLRRACDALLVVAFVAGLLASPLDHLLRPSNKRDTVSEYRTPAPFPERPNDLAALKAYPKQFDEWYVDHFGLRDVLLRWHNVVKWFGLGVSPTRKILVDDGGWIYPTEGMSLEDYRGAMPLLPGSLEAWKRMLEGRRDYLAKRGIQYVFVVVPYKTRIYSDRMPKRLEITGPTRGEQIVEYMKKHSDVTVLDMRPPVMAAKALDKPDDPAYFPLGVHWTDRGAFAGYSVLARELARRFPSIKPIVETDFAKNVTTDVVDSWAGRLYMSDLFPEHNTVWGLHAPRAKYTGNYAADPEWHSTCPDESLPRAQIYHDSFLLPLRPWLAEHFSQLHCYWSQELRLDRLDTEKPDIVIQIHNEQSLLRMTPQLTREEDDGARERRFQASREVLWKFTPERFPDGLRVEGKGTLRMEGDVLVYTRPGPSEFLHLPEIDYPRGADILVRIELEGPETPMSIVFYRTRVQPGIDRDHTIRSSVNAGRDTIVFEVPEADFTGRLTWWASAKPAILRIHSIEVRAARNP